MRIKKNEAKTGITHQKQMSQPAEVNKLSEAKTAQVKAEAEKRTEERLAEMRDRQTKAEQRLLAEQRRRKEEEDFKKQQQQIRRGILNENVERYPQFECADRRRRTNTRSR